MSKQPFITPFNIIFGTLFVSFIMYRRLSTLRLPKELWMYRYSDTLHLDYNIIIIVFLGMCLSSIMIYQSIQMLSKKPIKNNIFNWYNQKVQNFISNAFKDFYNFILGFIPYHKISTFAYYYYETFKTYSESLFVFLPFIIRLIVLSCFLVDVFVYFELYYMYKALYLLIISLSIKVMFYVLKDFAQNLPLIESSLIITPKGFDPVDNEPITHYALKPEHQDADLIYYIGQFILCNKVSGYLDMYDRYYNFFIFYFNFSVYLCYLLGWSYICIINGYNLYLMFFIKL